ncbi:MAG: Uma2 family endonuclease [Rhodospirillaceae bacterium]|nr:Uma2 family endonuclease [Rhodospirillaceae bacterium]
MFDEFDVLQPDVLFFRAERAHLVEPASVTRHAPDIVVEVLSPSTAAVNRGRKMRTFARYGVPEYWIVEPADGGIQIQALAGGTYREAQAAGVDDTVESALLPDLRFDAGRIFELPTGRRADRSRSP